MCKLTKQVLVSGVLFTAVFYGIYKHMSMNAEIEYIKSVEQDIKNKTDILKRML